MPKVSVVIPIYGVEKYIERCARSLFEQSLDDIEFVFMDDCSPDKSVIILKRVIEEYTQRLQEKHHHIKIETMGKNSGQAVVRHYAMQFCTGEYVIHCDSDDWVEETTYEAMYNKAKETDADVVVCDYVMTDAESMRSRIKGCHAIDINGFIESCLYQKDSWAVWNKMFKREAYKNIVYPVGAMGEDLVMTLQLLLNSKKLACTNAVYYYFINTDSITRKRTVEGCLKRYRQMYDNSQIVYDIVRDHKLTSEMSEALLSLRHHVANLLLPLVWKHQYRKEWLSLYSGVKMQFLFSRKIKFEYKIKFLLTLLGVYPRKCFRILS